MAPFISHAQDIIWGSGITEELAFAEAVKYGGEEIESLDTAPATDRLVAQVQALSGGHPIYPDDMKWEIKRGLADLFACK